MSANTAIESPALTPTQSRILDLRRAAHVAWVRMQRGAGQGGHTAADWHAARSTLMDALAGVETADVRAVCEAWQAEHKERTGVESTECNARTCEYGG